MTLGLTLLAARSNPVVVVVHIHLSVLSGLLTHKIAGVRNWQVGHPHLILMILT